MTIRIALYERVSTIDQFNGTQHLRLTELAQVRGWEVVQTYTDTESGSKRARPGLDAMLSDARAGRFQTVLAVRVDRIARSLQDLLEICGNLGSYGVSLSFSDQDLDISSSQGRLMLGILGAFSQYEREIIVERTKAGLRRARSQGKRLGRPTIHYMTRKRALELLGEGLSVRDVASRLGISKSLVSSLRSEGVQKTLPPNEAGLPIQEVGVQ
jgi:DNA invertase Pin-like site-specific DNA recombinase